MSANIIFIIAICTFLQPGDDKFDLSQDLSATGKATFNQLWADDLARVRGTPADKLDDVALAERMLQTAQRLGDSPDVQQVTWQNVVQLSLQDVSGIDLAEEAADELMRAKPEQIDGVRDLLIDHLDSLYRTSNAEDKKTTAKVLADWLMEAAEADVSAAKFDRAVTHYRRLVPLAESVPSISRAEVIKKVKVAQEGQKIHRKVVDIEARAQAGQATEAMYQQLTVIFLTEIEDIQKAERYANRSEDAHLRTIVRIAQKSGSDWSSDDAYTLGKWYQEQAKNASPFGKRQTLTKSLIAYEQFLETYENSDARRLEVELAIDEIRKKLDGDSANGRRKIDLLAKIDTNSDTVEGSWKKIGNILRVDGDAISRLRLPYAPPEEYDFIIEFTRRTGENNITQICRGRNGRGFAWVMGAWGNQVAALHQIDGKRSNDNDTTIEADRVLVNGKRYTSVVQVRKDRVVTIVNGKEYVRYETDFSNMNNVEKWGIGPGNLGIGSFRSAVTFYKIEVVEITGRGKLER